MSKILLCLGIVLIPYYQLILALLPHKTLSFEDTRADKLVLSLSIALIFSVVTFYKIRARPFRNKWILAFIAFTFINIFICPEYHFKIGNTIDLGGFWNYPPMAKILVYFLFAWAVCSKDWSELDIKHIISFMFWSGFGMACYIILQNYGLDQFYNVKTLAENQDVNDLVRSYIGGTMGQSTLVGPYVAMLIPFGFYLKRHIYACLMILAVFLTLSKFAIVAMLLGLAFYWSLKARKMIVGFLSILVITCIVLGVVYIKDPTVINRFEDNGRFPVWSQIIKDVREPVFDDSKSIYPWTGKGIGSYRYVFAQRYNTRFTQAHNEYLQTLQDGGIIGMGLLLLAVGSLLVGGIRTSVGVTGISPAILSSFAIIALCAVGTFVWQLGIYQFYTCIIVGLLIRPGE